MSSRKVKFIVQQGYEVEELDPSLDMALVLGGRFIWVDIHAMPVEENAADAKKWLQQHQTAGRYRIVGVSWDGTVSVETSTVVKLEG